MEKVGLGLVTNMRGAGPVRYVQTDEGKYTVQVIEVDAGVFYTLENHTKNYSLLFKSNKVGKRTSRYIARIEKTSQKIFSVIDEELGTSAPLVTFSFGKVSSVINVLREFSETQRENETNEALRQRDNIFFYMLEGIAKRELGVKTLRVYGMDMLHTVSTRSLYRALKFAFDVGRKYGR